VSATGQLAGDSRWLGLGGGANTPVTVTGCGSRLLGLLAPSHLLGLLALAAAAAPLQVGTGGKCRSGPAEKGLELRHYS
jgi:hypothetical protein